VLDSTYELSGRSPSSNSSILESLAKCCQRLTLLGSRNDSELGLSTYCLRCNIKGRMWCIPQREKPKINRSQRAPRRQTEARFSFILEAMEGHVTRLNRPCRKRPPKPKRRPVKQRSWQKASDYRLLPSWCDNSPS
jgi:hypothetical protein